jgi:hypothetical protein
MHTTRRAPHSGFARLTSRISLANRTAPAYLPLTCQQLHFHDGHDTVRDSQRLGPADPIVGKWWRAVVLTGRLFDRGNRMSPTHSNKLGVRYRCQSASDRDPLVLPFGRLALAPSKLVGVAETGRARFGV